jgi:hypothetical protein
MNLPFLSSEKINRKNDPDKGGLVLTGNGLHNINEDVEFVGDATRKRDQPFFPLMRVEESIAVGSPVELL